MIGQDFILSNAPSTDIGIPTLDGQTLLNINSNGYSPMYELISVKDFLMAPNGTFLINSEPSVGATLFGTIGNDATSVLSAASTQGSLLVCALIDQYPDATLKTVFARGVFNFTQVIDGGIRNDGNITPWVIYDNLTYTGPSSPCQTDIVYTPDVLSVTHNQPVIFNNSNKYNEAANGNAGLATLVAGTVTIANTAITANSRILLTVQDVNGGIPGLLSITNKVAGVSFDILSDNAGDTSIVYYEIREPA